MRRFALALSAALLLAPRSAAAAHAESTTSPYAESPRVDIRVTGDASALSRVERTAGELLSRLGVEPQVGSADEPLRVVEPPPLVIAHIDLRDTSAPSIEVEDGQTHELLMRRRLDDISSLETGVEAVLHVLYWAIESKLELGTEAPKKPEPAPEKPAPPRPARSRPAIRAAPVAVASRERRVRLGLDVGPLLRVSSFGGSRIVPGGGLSIEPRMGSGDFQLELGLSCALHGTTQLFFERGAAEVRPVQARIMPMLDWSLARDASAGFGLLGGFDSLSVTPLQPPQSGLSKPARSSVDPVLGGALGARLLIAGRAFLSALASLDVDLAPTSFVAREGGIRRAIWELPSVRGGLTLTLSFTLAGAWRFQRQPSSP